MKRVIVIGGGASGLVAAIYAKKNNNEVTILERNAACGKKILVTGNGKCNYFNEDQDLKHYHSTNMEKLKDIINDKNKKEILKFWENLGIFPKIKNGYYYPYSNQASSILSALLTEASFLGVKIVYNSYVTKIHKEKEIFKINTETHEYICDKVILATGSCAAPKTGSDGNGYDLIKPFHSKIIPVAPALVQLVGKKESYKNWSGIRLDACLSLYENKKRLKEERGELQLTDYGISGICTFNLSGEVAIKLRQKKDVYILINFVPFLDITNASSFVYFLNKRNQLLKNRTVDQLLEAFIPYKLIFYFMKKVGIKSQEYWENIEDAKKLEFANLFLNYKFEILETKSFESAQVCSGGISLNEINLNTMESLKVSGLYFAGEIIDIYGDCGGYNLTNAWISGYLAGSHVGQDHD